MPTTNNKGFTLVELSIVLVIIGLLIGGILAAQSMINTTKIQSFARQIGQFDAAVMNFKDKYNALPGDSLIAIGGAAGDGDGILEASSDDTALTWTGEVANFWIMLQTSGFKSEDGATYVSTSLSTTAGLDKTRAPQAKAGTATSFFVKGSTAALALGGASLSANGYVAAGCSARAAAGTTGQPNCRAGFSGVDAIAIDTKLDDGVGSTGNVAGVAVPAVVSILAPITGAATDYAATTAIASSLVIRMGNTAGNPQ